MTIDDRELARVNETLKTIPVFAGMALDMARIRRLGGMTNLVYQVQLGSDEFVLRLPGAGTEAYIDREVEAHNARVAAEAGVSAALVYVDPARGVMVTALLGGLRYDDGGSVSPACRRAGAWRPDPAASAPVRAHVPVPV